MNLYEMTVIMKPSLDEEAQQGELDKIQNLIERNGGTIDKVDGWGKRRLAYEIEKINEGIYYFINFQAPSAAPREIEDQLRITENYLRYMIVRDED